MKKRSRFVVPKEWELKLSSEDIIKAEDILTAEKSQFIVKSFSSSNSVVYKHVFPGGDVSHITIHPLCPGHPAIGNICETELKEEKNNS